MVVSEEGLAPGHLGKPQAVFMASQPAAHHVFHKRARVVPVQTAVGASLPPPASPTRHLTHREVSLPQALKEHKGQD